MLPAASNARTWITCRPGVTPRSDHVRRSFEPGTITTFSASIDSSRLWTPVSSVAFATMVALRLSLASLPGEAIFTTGARVSAGGGGGGGGGVVSPLGTVTYTGDESVELPAAS